MADGVLGVRELLRVSGNSRTFEGTLDLGEPGLTSASLDGSAPVTYTLHVESRGNQLFATGTIRARWIGPCRRCLGEAHGDVVTQVREIFDPHPVEGETWPIEDGTIDLKPLAIEALLLDLPLAPLCQDDCAGPDPEHYPMDDAERGSDELREVGESGGNIEAQQLDPRWAGLRAIHIDPETSD